MTDRPPPTRESATLAGGCFWCVEAVFRLLRGVHHVENGYSGGRRPNPTYEQVCGHGTGHAEAVRVMFDPAKVSYRQLLDGFFRMHDPTQLDRQGPDVGDQYRSAVFTVDDRQATIARDVTVRYGRALAEKGYGEVTTEIAPAKTFFLAEEYHQQYLEKRGQTSCHL